MDLPPEELLIHTLSLLEWRLKRLEFVLNGSSIQQESESANVLTRLHKLEQSLNQLAGKSDTVSELLKLQAHLPDLFTHPEEGPNQPVEELSDAQKLSMVLAEAPAYSTMASQLRSLHDVTLPDSQGFANLVALQPRIAELGQRQFEQAMEISDLRKRSGTAILRWHEVFILGQGRCWADWDTRLRDTERDVRREERRAQEEQ